MSKEYSIAPSKRREGERQVPTSSSRRQHSQQNTHALANPANPSPIMTKVQLMSSRMVDKSFNNKHDRLGDVPHSSDIMDQVDVSRLTEDLTKMIFQNENECFMVKRQSECHQKLTNAKNVDNKGKKASMLLDENQTQQIKKILVDCLHNIDRSEKNISDSHRSCQNPCENIIGNYVESQKPIIVRKTTPLLETTNTDDSLAKTSLLRSYLSGSNPAREEYVSKRRNVSNSLISSDSVHHSIFLESGRERRQCLLQYLSNVLCEGQAVIYVNSIPGAEALMNFLTKHGFQVNTVHSRLLLAESNWVLSEFALKKFAVLICAEDHCHSCPAHFRWVKTIINYELPICNPLENWSIRNGIVEFSDNLPVHIYTFIKKSCPLDHELVKLLNLDSLEEAASQEP